MNGRAVSALLMLTSLCLISSCRRSAKAPAAAAGAALFDVSMEGPWILYEDMKFVGKNGSTTPVLIAIAPMAATADSPLPEEYYHHRPQLSTGVGYELENPFIYCLTVDSQCAPNWATSSTSGGYPDPQLLPVSFHTGNPNPAAHWDWVSSRGNNVTLILPMPDSISGDGIWTMRFVNSQDGTYSAYQIHSIGLHLHYSKAAAAFDLEQCDNKQPSYATCTPPQGPKSYHLVNTGTLRIEMRAPDTNDTCDLHVRYAYQQALAIIDPNETYNQTIAVIDPAADVNNGDINSPIPADSSCMTKATQTPPPPKKTSACKRRAVEAMNTMLIMPMLQGLLSSSLQQIDELKSKHINSPDPDLDVAALNAKAAKGAAEGLDTNFPRVSQLLRIGNYVRTSAKAMARFAKRDRNTMDSDLICQILQEQEKQKDLAGKHGNDCRAAVMMVTP